jgi:hypothetical protein
VLSYAILGLRGCIRIGGGPPPSIDILAGMRRIVVDPARPRGDRSGNPAAGVKVPDASVLGRSRGIIGRRWVDAAYGRLVSMDNITRTNEYGGGVGAHGRFSPTQHVSFQKDLDIAAYTDRCNPIRALTV